VITDFLVSNSYEEFQSNFFYIQKHLKDVMFIEKSKNINIWHIHCIRNCTGKMPNQAVKEKANNPLDFLKKSKQVTEEKQCLLI